MHAQAGATRSQAHARKAQLQGEGQAVRRGPAPMLSSMSAAAPAAAMSLHARVMAVCRAVRVAPLPLILLLAGWMRVLANKRAQVPWRRVLRVSRTLCCKS